MKSIRPLIVAILLIGIITLTGCDAGGVRAKNGDTVQVHYTGKLADGTVFDSSVGKEPLEFTLGTGFVIPGFDKAVLGMKIGEKKTVTIPASEAYGPRYEEAIIEVSRDGLPGEWVPKVGDQLPMESSDGRRATGTIIEVSDTTVTVDLNDRLAGKDLTFDIELVKIE